MNSNIIIIILAAAGIFLTIKNAKKYRLLGLIFKLVFWAGILLSTVVRFKGQFAVMVGLLFLYFMANILVKKKDDSQKFAAIEEAEVVDNNADINEKHDD